MLKRSFSFLLLLISLCGLTQNNDDKAMKKTGDNLLKYLSKGDTAAIIRLYADYYFDEEDRMTEKEYKEGITRILEDCKTYQKVTKKYGFPNRKDFTITDGINAGKQLIITFSDKRDTILNWSYCKIVIQFYPVSLLSPEVFYDYHFDTGPISEKLKITPTIPAIKNN